MPKRKLQDPQQLKQQFKHYYRAFQACIQEYDDKYSAYLGLIPLLHQTAKAYAKHIHKPFQVIDQSSANRVGLFQPKELSFKIFDNYYKDYNQYLTIEQSILAKLNEKKVLASKLAAAFTDRDKQQKKLDQDYGMEALQAVQGFILEQDMLLKEQHQIIKHKQDQVKIIPLSCAIEETKLQSNTIDSDNSKKLQREIFVAFRLPLLMNYLSTSPIAQSVNKLSALNRRIECILEQQRQIHCQLKTLHQQLHDLRESLEFTNHPRLELWVECFENAIKKFNDQVDVYDHEQELHLDKRGACAP